MEATALSLARSVLDGVISSAGSAIADEVARLIGVPKEVEFIRNELEMMQAFLKVASTHPEATVRNDIVKTWVKQVRDLAYDVEDCLLDFALYAVRTSSSRAGTWLPGAIAERHRIAQRIRDLKSSVEELNRRNQRYHIVLDNPAARVEEQPVLPDYDMHSDELAFQVSEIIGREEEKKALIKQISGGNAELRGLRLVSVWGMGGMGKSSLVHMVHNDAALLDVFDCGAWVTVPHPLDNPDVFAQRLKRELGVAELGECLRAKRYRVIVDDLLSQEEWEHVWKVFQTGNKEGSLIIVTTRREDVARHCAANATDGHGYIYKLEQLGDVESMNLLCRKVYKSAEYTLPEDMVEQANQILTVCHGLPLAISTIGGLLGNRPKTSIEWRNMYEHLGAELGSDLRRIPNVIESSYDGLPYHLKSIFLYLSIFPVNHEMRRTRLLRRWIAEGHIARNRDMPTEDVGERFFSELINRSMIQPCKLSHGSIKATRCRVHSMLLQIILPKSIEENQLFFVEKHSSMEVPQSKIRHLVVSRWKTRDEKLENINFSYVRSLTIFGECPASLISPKMQLLRVLDLEDTDNLKNGDLKHIGELQHLRYLSLRRTNISKLPSSLQKLRYLETLDIQDTQVAQLPGGIAKLEKMRYLLSGVNFKKLHKKMAESSGVDNHNGRIFRRGCCKVFSVDQFSVRAPKGIEKLKNLHVLGVVNVGKGNGVSRRLTKLANLMNLRRLGARVTGLTEKEGDELCKSIGELDRLQSLELRSDSLDFLDRMHESAIPTHLISLRLCGKLTRLPEWISSLNNLAKVKLLGTELKQQDILHLQDLRNLALLGLWENSYAGDSLVFFADTFLKLKFLDIGGLGKTEKVTIHQQAMPQLEQLWLKRCPLLQNNKHGLSGVTHLPNLMELVLKNCGEKGSLIRILQRQVNAHPRRPKFLIGKSKMPTRTAAE